MTKKVDKLEFAILSDVSATVASQIFISLIYIDYQPSARSRWLKLSSTKTQQHPAILTEIACSNKGFIIWLGRI